MDYISMILIALVLTAQVTLFVLFFLEKRHSKRRYNAILQYIDRRIDASDCREEIESDIKKQFASFEKKTEERFLRNESVYDERFARHHDAIVETKRFVSEQVNGLLLDYTQAQEAANKVNEFATGLASIFDYDPIEAMKRNRQREAS